MARRPFDTHPKTERPEFFNSVDLLFQGREIVTGGQRPQLYANYLAALAARGLDPAPRSGYLVAFQ